MGLNPKLLAYRKLRMGGISRYQAAKQSGFSREMCLRASRLDDAITVALPEILAKEDVDNFLAAQTIKAGLVAERAIVTEKKTFGPNGKLQSVDPVITWVPDMFIRHKYLETYLSVTGQNKTAKINGDTPENLPQLIINTLNISVDKRETVEVIR